MHFFDHFTCWGQPERPEEMGHARAGKASKVHTMAEVATHDSRDDLWVYRNQLDTTLDVDCPPWLDWLHGGVHFQVVHHLWPRLPRHALRQATAEFDALCAKHGLRRKHLGFVAANQKVLRKLRAVANASRKLL